MGEVWRALDTRLEREVAVKLLRPEHSDRADLVERLRRECTAAARLRSPHIARVHNSGTTSDGRFYIDMELVEGVSLSDLLQEHGPLPPERAVGIVEQIADALDTAHAQGIVHRDVKPGNVMVTAAAPRGGARPGARGSADHVVLIDFGICRPVVGLDGAPGVTAEDQLVGTPDYAAPERLRTDDATPAVDVYSLACVLHELVTGRPPFHAVAVAAPDRPALATLLAHRDEPRPAASAVEPAVVPALDDVIARGMAVDPAARYATAGDLARSARSALRRSTVPLPRDPLAPPPTAAAGALRLRRPARTAVAAAVRRAGLGAVTLGVVAGLGATGWTLATREQPSTAGVRLEGAASAVALAADGLGAWVALDDRDQAVAVDLASGRVTTRIAVADAPRDVVLTADGSTAYVANSGDGSVAVADAAVGAVRRTVAVGGAPVGLALSPDESQLHVALSSDAAVAVIDTRSLELVRELTVGAWWLADSVHAVALSPEGTTLAASVRAGWLAVGAQDRVVLVDLATGTQRSVDVGDDPGAVAFADGGRRVCVANGSSASVSVVDAETAAVVTTVPLGGRPTSITAAGDRVHVATAGGSPLSEGAVSVISLATNAVVATVPAPRDPTDTALTADGAHLLVVTPEELRLLPTP
jgi:serine/threonine-protein kinase